jgi:hypothetical protein
MTDASGYLMRPPFLRPFFLDHRRAPVCYSLETNGDEIAKLMREFLGKHVSKK